MRMSFDDDSTIGEHVRDTDSIGKFHVADMRQGVRVTFSLYSGLIPPSRISV